MQQSSNTNSALLNEPGQIVEIKLWSLYLFINRGSLYGEMVESSLDQGPVEKNPHYQGRVTFRFSVKSWEGKIKRLLYDHRVPVVLKSPVPITASWISRLAS